MNDSTRPSGAAAALTAPTAPILEAIPAPVILAGMLTASADCPAPACATPVVLDAASQKLRVFGDPRAERPPIDVEVFDSKFRLLWHCPDCTTPCYTDLPR